MNCLNYKYYYYLKNVKIKIDFKKLEKYEKKQWIEIENRMESEIALIYSVEFLCYCIKKQNIYKRNFIVLINDYDKILINSIEYNYYKDIQCIIKSMFSNIFKGNEYLYFGVVTGCLDRELKDIFSGANNFIKCSLHFDDHFS